MSKKTKPQKKESKKESKKEELVEEAPAPKKKIPKITFFTKIKDSYRKIVEVILAFKTKDNPTRFAVILFLLSFTGLLITFGLGVKTLYQLTQDQNLFEKDEDKSIQGENLSKFFKEQQETAFSKEATLELGKFSVEMIPPPGTKVRQGVVHTAVIHITIECKTIPTCRFIEKNLDKARDQIFTVFVPIPQREILSAEGKRKIKDDIKEKLNEWLPQGGSVHKVYFTKLVAG